MSWKKKLLPQAGDILRVHRKAGYYHYGIAVSNNRVVHFTAGDEDLSKNKKDMQIIESSLDRFLLGGTLQIESPYRSSYDPEVVVERAKSYVNSPRFRGKYYNFVTNNCEHFANFIYYGEAVSTPSTTRRTRLLLSWRVCSSAIIPTCEEWKSMTLLPEQVRSSWRWRIRLAKNDARSTPRISPSGRIRCSNSILFSITSFTRSIMQSKVTR